MSGRLVKFNVENPTLGTDIFGKKQFYGFKNRNSKEFSLQNLKEGNEYLGFNGFDAKSLRSSPLPLASPVKSKPSFVTPKGFEFEKEIMDSRLVKLDEMRKKINMKIFEIKKEEKALVGPPNKKLAPLVLRKVSPEKFLESITYSKADLNVPSRYIPTDRNTNKILEENMYKPTFNTPIYTKNSPKMIFTNPIV